MTIEKIQTLLKQLPNGELIGLRKKLSRKIKGLKIRELIKTHNLAPKSLEKYEAGDKNNAGLTEFVRDLYTQELSKSEGILNYVSRLSLEMKQKVQDLRKSEIGSTLPKPDVSKPEREKSPARKAAFQTGEKVTRSKKPVIKRKIRITPQEEKGLMILVAVGLPVSTTVSYDPGGMTIRVSGGRKTLNNLVVSLKARS